MLLKKDIKLQLALSFILDSRRNLCDNHVEESIKNKRYLVWCEGMLDQWTLISVGLQTFSFILGYEVFIHHPEQGKCLHIDTHVYDQL